jgi:D-alanyl-D-alanine carboxypeptidase
VYFLRPLLRRSSLNIGFLAAALAIVAPHSARAEALLLVEADSGKVLKAQDATVPWYPASLSKMMTAYVTLKAVKEGRISLDTLLTVSPTAASQSPSKMGFKPGTQLTVDNALKMMLVKSANDMAVVLAEGVGGSIDGFSVMMNDAAQKLGMTQTSYVNPNGLPADGQITSARDLAILARGIIHDLPEYEYFVHIPSIRFGRRVTQNFNKLIGRYPGADGFKTGFICASGYNLVGSATRDGRRLIAVVLGASSGTMRAVRAAQLLDSGFAGNGLTWLKPSLGTVDQLAPIDASPPNLRDEMCSGKHHAPPSDADEEALSGNAGASTGETGAAFFSAAGLQAPLAKPSDMMAAAPAPSEPIVVYTGPTKTGAALIAVAAAETEKQAAEQPKGRHKTRIAAKKPDTGAVAQSADAPAKPAARHAGSKPATPVAAGDAASKPAKPKTAAKPGAKSGSKSTKSSSGDSKPAG